MDNKPVAFFEYTAGVVRVLPPGSAWGDPYRYGMAVSADEGIVTLKSLTHHQPTGDEFRAIFKALRAAAGEVGLSQIRWTRHRPDGSIHVARFDLAPAHIAKVAA